MIPLDSLVDNLFGFTCRTCAARVSEFKVSFQNPRHGLCDDCEDNEPIPTEDE